MLLVGAALAVVLHRLLGSGVAQTAGLFHGALTNTPAWWASWSSSVTCLLSSLTPALWDDPVIAYPIGVLGVMTAISVLAQRLWNVDYPREAVDSAPT